MSTTETDLRRAAINYLRGLRDAGVIDLPAGAESRLHELVQESVAEYEVASPDAVPAEPATTPAVEASPTNSGSLFDSGAADRYGPTGSRTG